ncbi:SDR family oxidoreductase [Frigoriglobus tundricola]|uniref:SDR family oxidoreductase n=1 Tax=Frigoriglobus tundricola TaxID=2774151 RepID=UPI001D06F647|nr:SDR family oxidoreductase [Frigoriglobus tundricola]
MILGCGYLGRRVARLWRGAGHRVAALTRGNADALRASGIEPIGGDVLEPGSLRALPGAATVLYAVGWDRAAGRPMRDVYVSGLANVLAALPTCARFLYVSSTSVYGQSDGGWVTEASATEPTEESGRIVLEAEQLLRAHRPDAIVLRFAGLYGPDRLLRKQPILRGEPLVGDADKWLNLVHVADGAAAVLCAEARGVPSETYHIADGTPVPRRDFYTRLAELLHAPEAKFDHRAEPGAPNRRIDSSKARAALGWVPEFASYRDGLPVAVRESVL